jgi:CHAT domain-containing protein
LLASREEAEAIMNVVPWRTGFKALDFDASRATLSTPKFGQYRVLHFATHAMLDDQHPELSGIILSLVDAQGRPLNGFLRMSDIYDLKLSSNLVVLSACNTALGKEVRGEGLIGLTRGFLYAGASGVTASLWKVDDEATAALMKHFYEGMFQKGLTPAAALRQAQLAMWNEKQWRAPYYWAAFVLQGRYNQMETSDSRWISFSTGKIAFSAIIILLLSTTLLIFIRRRVGNR